MTDFTTSFFTLDNLESIVRLFVGTIVVKYIITKWIAEKTKNIFKYLFVKGERELAIYVHYFNTMIDKNHSHTKK